MTVFFDRLTAADVVVGYCVMWTSVIKGGRIIYDYPNVKSYLARLKLRPKFSKTMGTARDWVNSDDAYVRGESSDWINHRQRVQKSDKNSVQIVLTTTLAYLIRTKNSSGHFNCRLFYISYCYFTSSASEKQLIKIICDKKLKCPIWEGRLVSFLVPSVSERAIANGHLSVRPLLNHIREPRLNGSSYQNTFHTVR